MSDYAVWLNHYDWLTEYLFWILT